MLLSYPNSVGLIATSGEEVVGLILGNCEPWSDGMSFYLNELCVSSDERRGGVGQSLLETLVNELREREVANVYLLTEHGSIAETFFKNLGFEVDSTTIKLWKSI